MKFSKIGVIAWHEFITNVRRVGFIVMTFAFPVFGALGLVIAGFFAAPARSVLTSQFTPPRRPAGIVDHSRRFVPIAPAFAKAYVAFPDEARAKQALLADEIHAYYVIAEDYVATGQVTWYAKNLLGSSASVSEPKNTLSAFLVTGLLAGQVDAVTLERVAVPAEYKIITLDSKGDVETGGAFSFIAGFVAPYIFSVLLMVAVFTASGYLLRSVSEEKETRVIEIILSSVTPTELLTGKVIGLGALGLAQVAVWIVAGMMLSGGLGVLFAGAVAILNPGAFLLAVAYFLFGYLLFGTLMATAGSLGTSLRESQQLAGIFTFGAAVPWFLLGVLFANPDALIIRLASFFPLTAPMMMMLRLPMTDVPVVDIVGSLIVLAFSIPLVMWLGAKIFHIGLLMYGKRPSLREIWRAMRHA